MGIVKRTSEESAAIRREIRTLEAHRKPLERSDHIGIMERNGKWVVQREVIEVLAEYHCIEDAQNEVLRLQGHDPLAWREGRE